MEKNFYDFKINSLNEKNGEINFTDLQGKVVIIVNTASKCGYTPQYSGLESLYKKYGEKGLFVIGFPCNQFGGQEPDSPQNEIQTNCLINYGVSFPITEKVDVNGENTTPAFQFLKEKLPGILGTKDIKWNFTKFLIDKNGTPIKRFAPADSPESMEADILKLL